MQLEYTFTYRDKDGGTQLILSYKDARGKWHQKSKQGFKGHNDAKRAQDDLLNEVKEKVSLDSDYFGMQDITLGQFKDLFLREQEKNLEYSTRDSYDFAITAFSDIADMKLTEITYADIVNCVNKLSYKAGTQLLYLSKIKRLFRYAISPYKLIKSNPAADIMPQKDKEAKKIHALTKSELSSLLNFMKNDNYVYYTMAAIAGYAGLRYGEIIGLTWNNVHLKTKHKKSDTEDGTITVCQQYGKTGKGKFELKPTKSINGNRVVPIPVPLIHALDTYKKSLKVYSIDHRLFPISHANSNRLNWYISKWNKRTTVHDLRHTYATQLLANGVDIRTVAALLGDKTKTVIETYVHYTDEMRKKAKEDINKIFCG